MYIKTVRYGNSHTLFFKEGRATLLVTNFKKKKER